MFGIQKFLWLAWPYFAFVSGFILVTIFGSWLGLWIYLERYKKNYKPDFKFGTPSHVTGALSAMGCVLDVVLIWSLFSTNILILTLIALIIFRSIIAFYSVYRQFGGQ